MSLASAYNTRSEGSTTVWLTSAVKIQEGDTYPVRITNVVDIETKFNGPGWAFYGETGDGMSVKVESPWVRTNREGKATDLAFVFLAFLRAALRVANNNMLPAADTYASEIDTDAPILNTAALKSMVGGCWVRIRAQRVRIWGEAGDRQDVEWRVVGPATAEDAPTGNAPAEQAAPYADDDDIPF